MKVGADASAKQPNEFAPNNQTIFVRTYRERTDYLCEMKFSEHMFTIDKKYELELEGKIDAFRQSKQHTKTHSIQLVIVTTNGVQRGVHSKDVNRRTSERRDRAGSGFPERGGGKPEVNQEVTLEDLFD